VTKVKIANLKLIIVIKTKTPHEGVFEYEVSLKGLFYLIHYCLEGFRMVHGQIGKHFTV